ncbi:MAG: ABC transporter permease subunit [Clostridiales bacterium]|nr:ABC transporter permease subunit [Clostridiales bacterium]
MNKLIHAGFKRLFINKLFWLSCAAMFAIGTCITAFIQNVESIDRIFFIYTLPAGLLIAAVASMFIGTDYSDGTLRNKLIVGHKRSDIYFSNLILTFAAGIIICAAYIVPVLAIGLIRIGGFSIETKVVLGLFGITVALIAAFAAINNMISMLSKNKATTVIICLILFIVLLLAAMFCNAKLDEPEFETGIVMTANGIEFSDPVPNPRYLSGVKRDICQFIYDFNPAGQSMMFTNLSMVHFWQLAAYSLIIVVITTTAGIIVFKRKDLN